MGSNPSKFKDCGEDCPVEMVSWNDGLIRPAYRRWDISDYRSDANGFRVAKYL